MSLVSKINELAIRLGEEFHNLRADEIGTSTLTSLTTTSKVSLVSAINELNSAVAGMVTTIINDSVTVTNKTWSSSKINTKLAADIATGVSSANSYTDAAIIALVNGAPTALDTLKEIADALAADDSDIAALIVAVDNRVSYSVQTKTSGEKLIARTNIGAITGSEVMPIVLASEIPESIVSIDDPTVYPAILPGAPATAFQNDINAEVDDYMTQVGTRVAIAAADFVVTFEAEL